ncbi:MAG: winged helix-turn-helix domain-containing protein [Bacteroidota bacterium]
MKIALYIGTVIFAFALSLAVTKNESNSEDDTFPNRVKVALRNTGNTLLLQSGDSTSLVFPVTKNGPNTFQLTFQMKLSIVPDSLVASVHKSFRAMNLPNDYLVEVVDCSNLEVSYSYSISNNEESNIVPCLGRNLPMKCYTINVIFPNPPEIKESQIPAPWYTLVLFGTLGIGIFFWVRHKENGEMVETVERTQIGNYTFYKDRNMLVKGDVSIQLTAKETELLQLFSDNVNQVVSRDQLLKEVWESKGIFVGRSLDTFISKLRKKFQDDDNINILNVHGVGYKLEVVKKPRK